MELVLKKMQNLKEKERKPSIFFFQIIFPRLKHKLPAMKKKQNDDLQKECRLKDMLIQKIIKNKKNNNKY